MKLKKAIAATLILTAATAGQPACAGKKTQDLIDAYAANRYDSAEALGERIVARHPNDYTAHYYLANTYVILRKNEEAMKEYRICINSGEGGALKQFSTTALERLLKQKEKALVAAAKNGANPEEKELKDFKKKIRQEAQAEQQKIRQEWNQAMRDLDRNSYRPSGFNRGFRGGYGRNDSSMRERYRLNEYYSKKLAELSDYEESMISQANCGKGRIRIQPSLSNSKVKNYINYGDEGDVVDIPVDNPLQAVARSLNDPQSKQTKPVASTKNNRTGKNSAKPTSTPTAKPAPSGAAK